MDYNVGINRKDNKQIIMSDKKEIQIKKEVSVVVKEAQGIKIKSSDDMTIAVELLSKVNKQLDAVTEEKERITKPLNEALKVEHARWKPIETELETAKTILKKEMTGYQAEQLRLQKIQEEKIEARVEKGTLKFETAARKMGEIEVAPKKVSADSGSVKFKTIKNFQVIDVKKLPVDCLLPDTGMIRKKMNAGIEVDGVRYFEEQQLANFR